MIADRRCHVLLLIAVGLPLPGGVGAQLITGTIKSRVGDEALQGVLVSLVRESNARIEARGLSDERGAFLLRASGPGEYRVTAKRIGIVPSRSPIIRLETGGSHVVDLTVEGVVIPLPVARVSARAECGRDAARADATARLLEESRTALATTALSAGRRGLRASLTRFVRHLEPQTELVRAETTYVQNGAYDRPFGSISPDSLERFGYAVSGVDGSITFFAPDATVLASDSFLASHCFTPVRHESDSTLRGLAFRPVPSRRRPDIDGVMWLDQRTAELRSLRYSYTRLPDNIGLDDAGAILGFRRVGVSWMVSDWAIRTPLVRVASTRPLNVGRLSVEGERRDSVVTIREEGGYVELEHERKSLGRSLTGSVRATDDQQSRQPILIVLSGSNRYVLSDSTGQFRIDGVLPGRYRLWASRETTDRLPGAFAQTIVTVTAEGSQPVSLALVPEVERVGSICPRIKARDDRGGVRLVFLDTAGRRVRAGVQFALNGSRFERVGLEGVAARPFESTGLSSPDGTYTGCLHRAGDRLSLTLHVQTTPTRQPLREVGAGATLIRHVVVGR